jgi:hypothetical protein
MIKNIIDLLKMDDFHNVSKDIDTAKGKYQIPHDWKDVRNLFRRL